MKNVPPVFNRSLATLVLGAIGIGAAAFASQPEPLAVAPAQSEAVAQVEFAPAPVNKLCPIMENEVDANSPTRQFKGVTIGFCCPGCDRKWDRKSDEAKMAMLIKSSPEAVAAINAVNHPALKVARDYLSACGSGDAAALNALFLDNGRATVSENAADEGTWETYRDRRLLPYLKDLSGVVVTVAKEDVRSFGTTSIVRQIGSFSVPAPIHPDAPRKFLVAVTYVIVEDEVSPKIAHLHWSSLAENERATDADARREIGRGVSTGHERE